MKSLRKFLIVANMIVVSILFSISDAKAWMLPNLYAGFVFDTSTSGWLYCQGRGSCASVIGNQIFFNTWVGNWNYDVVKDDGKDHQYYIDNIVAQ